MKLSSSITTTTKLATLTLTMLAALTVLNTAIHAAPSAPEPIANAQVASHAYASGEEAFNTITDSRRRRAEPEEAPPNVPIVPHGPLLHRRAGVRLGKINTPGIGLPPQQGLQIAGVVGGGHIKRGESSVGGGGENKKRPKPTWHYKRGDDEHQDGGQNKRPKPTWHYKRGDDEHQDGGQNKKRPKPTWHYKRGDDEHQDGGQNKKKSKPTWRYKRAEPKPKGEENKKEKESRLWHF